MRARQGASQMEGSGCLTVLATELRVFGHFWTGVMLLCHAESNLYSARTAMAARSYAMQISVASHDDQVYRGDVIRGSEV